MDPEPYVEDKNTKIIDHVVYRLCDYGNETHYDVYDWFDTVEAANTVEEITIVSEIDGIKVKGIQCWLGYDPEIDSLNHRYWKNHNYSVKKVVIPDTITSIGDGFFSALDGIEELQIPASIKNGSDRRFMGMESLKEITFLGNATYLSGFSDCAKLESVIVKGTVKCIGESAFKNCISLVNFEIPDTVTEILRKAFAGSGLTSVTIPENAVFFDGDFGNAFQNCINLTEVIFAGEERAHFKINFKTFAECTALKTVVLPKTCKSLYIDFEAFEGCTALEEIMFPESCGNITVYDSAFLNCNTLEYVTFPKNCGKVIILDDTFRNCTSLETVTLPANCDSITIGYRAFRDCKNLTTVNNTENITKIYGGAFRDCTSLESFTISEKTTMIGKNAFYGCTNLKNVTVNSKTKAKAPKLYSGAFAKTNSALTFTAKNATSAKNWKTALTKSGLKNAKVGYMQYV